jgi:hypothetical protein
MRRAIGPAALVPLLACLVWACTASALSIDGTATVDYSGHLTQTFVYQPTDPSVWQGTLDMTWDEKETFSLSGRAQKNPTVKVLSRSLTISGFGHQHVCGAERGPDVLGESVRATWIP